MAVARPHPGIGVTLVTGFDMLNLARGEADIALRNQRPQHNTLVARRLADGAMAFYASANYLEKRGLPEPGFAGHAVILPIEKAMALPLFGDAANVSRYADVVLRLTDIVTGIAAAKAGLGLALLPCAATIGHPELIPVPPGIVSRPETYLLTHKDLRDQARVRVVLEFLVDCFKRHEAAIAGRDIGNRVWSQDLS